MPDGFPRVARYDLSGRPGRVLVVGDVHGCFEALAAALGAIDYDAARDSLFLLGDIVDRGPASLAYRDWLHVGRVRGNHEAMVLSAAWGDAEDARHHAENGGEWLQALHRDEQQLVAAELMDAPLAIELLTPRGRRVGFVHADVEGDDWPAFLAALADPGNRRTEQVAIWSRRRIGDVEADRRHRPAIAGIDHVFFGHNIVDRPLTRGNCSWIDTGAGAGGLPTVVDVDAWLAALA